MSKLKLIYSELSDRVWSVMKTRRDNDVFDPTCAVDAEN